MYIYIDLYIYIYIYIYISDICMIENKSHSLNSKYVRINVKMITQSLNEEIT